MSLMAEYHAKMFLDSKPTADQIRARIAQEKEGIKWCERNMGTGMDGGARSIHKATTTIKVLEAGLREMEAPKPAA